MEPLRLAGIGCGSRTTTYLRLAAERPDRYAIVGGADPVAGRVDRVAALSGRADFRRFASADDLLAADRFADVVVIGTQDRDHVGPCLAALHRGYDVLLEKPIATDLAAVLHLEATARQLGRRVLVCHVLRYTPFYQTVKRIVDDGQLGDVVTVHASEGVGPFHQAHSFVRGHWGVTADSSPMILQKSCHDLDVIAWIVGRPATAISSFGSLSHFSAEHLPTGAPPRCIDGCPVGDACPFNAMRYLTTERRWLSQVYDGADRATDDDVRGWLRTSPWGRCVYRCGQTAVDRQVVNVAFAGGATATFAMSAFDTGRNLEVWGTRGVLRGGAYTRQVAGCDLTVRDHETGQITSVNVDAPTGGYAGHGGGDAGLVSALYDEMRTPDPADMRSSLAASVQSHLMAFAAEASRLTGRTVDVEPFRAAHAPPT